MKKTICILVTLFFISFSVMAQIKLPHIISSNMVIQRDAPVKIWGTAHGKERIVVHFNKQTVETKANKKGHWEVFLEKMDAGGPFKMVIKGKKNTVKLDNILVGDLWICSGQSNMEMSVKHSQNAENEIAMANHENIRLFTVPRKISSKPLYDTEDSTWLACTSKNIPNFSAVAYYFAKNLQQDINVPIGLVHSSWGGTDVETWTSAKSLKKYENIKNGLQRLKSFTSDRYKYEASLKKKLLNILGSLPKKDLGIKKGKAIWANADYDYSTWKTMKIPQLWEDAGLIDLNGILWFQTYFELNEEEAKHKITLHLGKIDDSDDTYINGIRVGGMKNSYNRNRIYAIKNGIAKSGKNNLVIRVEDVYLSGGFSSSEKELFIQTINRKIPLSKLWKYKAGKVTIEDQNGGNPNALPTLLFNGMISPLLPMSIKGAIWYQGENNANRAYEYRKLFPNMIQDWRKHFNQGDFPFLFVQLANYTKAVEKPKDSNWAELREAQSMVINNTKNTGMAVIIDIGEAKDIHPENKQDVGKRLAIAALKTTYGKSVNTSPMYESIQITNNLIRVKFSDVGSGLQVKDKYGYVKGFAVAGVDKKFYWAKAYIENKNTVIVTCDKVKNPIAIRYAWANNPDDVNLYNADNLPASPFRTDTWSGVTKNNKISY